MLLFEQTKVKVKLKTVFLLFIENFFVSLQQKSNNKAI